MPIKPLEALDAGSFSPPVLISTEAQGIVIAPDGFLDERDYSRQRVIVETANALLAAVDVKDRFTRGHSIRVARYCDAIARRLGFDEEARAELRVAALLHDVGKLGIPESVLGRPGPLRPDEFAVIRRHPLLGYTILRPATVFREVLPVVLHHHECWNGGGYPGGLAGEAIPLRARILAVADALDAMLAKRSYQPRRDVREARAELIRCRGTQFDPAIVDLATEWLDEATRAAAARVPVTSSETSAGREESTPIPPPEDTAAQTTG